MVRIAALALLFLAGCAGGYDYRPPANPAEKAETDTQLALIARAVNSLQARDYDLCSHLGDRCVIKILVGPGDNGIGAGSDGKVIHINLPLLRMLKTDDERAVVIGHEWAHNLVHWPRGTTAFGRQAEFEADCIGALLAQRAGFNATLGAESLRRVGSSATGLAHAMFGGATHPGFGERYDAIVKVAGSTAGKTITRETIRQACGVAF